LLFALGLIATIAGVAVPQASATLDEYRTSGAARYLAGRIARTRIEAVARSANVGLRFVSAGSTYTFAVFADGNGDGLRTRDIQRGVDAQLTPTEHLPDNFPGVDFGAFPSLPAIDVDSSPPGDDPIRLGSGNLLSYSPAGTSSSGTLYLHGRATQFAIRVYGDTGRIRLFRYDARTSRWTQA